MKVSNMISSNNNRVANQFIIEGATMAIDGKQYTGTMFQSHGSNIAFESDKTFLDERYWDYSRTTGKYRNLFLGESKRETENKIKSGEYVLTNLN